MRFFRPEIEAAIKMLGVATIIGLIVGPFAWGYEQRKRARTWQNVACAYRIKEIARHTPIMATLDYGREPCSTLTRLGLDLELPGQ